MRLRSASKHPFIYQRMLGKVASTARPGDIVTVFDKAGRYFGRGLFNPRSQIAVRMYTWADEPFAEALWRRRLDEAVALRRLLRIEECTDAYRLVHAEGDALSGLVVERYADCLAIEVFSLGVYQRLDRLTPLLAEALGPPDSLDRPGRASPSWRVVVRADRSIQSLEGFRIDEAVNRGAPGSVTIREHGLRYRVDPTSGHKTGFFCDQRDNRLKLARLCRGARVLDLCCYSAGFGLAALKLGAAAAVTSVDLDEAALALARENINLNQARIDLVQADAFIYLRQMLELGRQYDVVVLDPPKLATARDGRDAALIKYHDLNTLAMQVVRPGGVLLTCSCSGLISRECFRTAVAAAGRRAGRTLQLFDESGAAPDHPVRLNCPESEYLKALWFRLP